MYFTKDLGMLSAPAEGFLAASAPVLHSSSTAPTKSMRLSRSRTCIIMRRHCSQPRLIMPTFVCEVSR